MLYINGPYFLNEDEDELTLRPNLGTWNRLYGMLFVEQPIGTGFSLTGRQVRC
jgi:vitellogenic carboxypeptidase-like protein